MQISIKLSFQLRVAQSILFDRGIILTIDTNTRQLYYNGRYC